MNKIVKYVVIIILILLIVILFHFHKLNSKPFFDNAENLKYTLLLTPSHLGEEPVSLNSLIIKSRELTIQEVSQKKIRVVICMHDINNDWSKTLLNGLSQTLHYYGIKILAVTDGEFKVEKQILDIENAIKLKPNFILSLPLDSEKMTNVYKNALNNNVKLIFFDSVPKGFKPKKDYLALIIGDAYQLGARSARYLATIIGNKGEIALLTWKNKMYTVDQRTKGAIDELSKYDSITIVKNIQFTEFYEIEALVKELLNDHPRLSGLWAVWDTPAFEAIKVFQKQKNNVKVATVDMSKEVAQNIMMDKHLKVTAVDNPFLSGIAGGLLVAINSAGKEHKSYIVTPSDIIIKDNVEDKWEKYYQYKLNLIKTTSP